MKNIKTFDNFLNEYNDDKEIKFSIGEVKGNEIRVNGVANKLYLVNFDKTIEPGEKKKFLQHIKQMYGTVITNMTTHLGDLVITFSIYVTTPMAQAFKEILNDIFTARAEGAQENPHIPSNPQQDNKHEPE